MRRRRCMAGTLFDMPPRPRVDSAGKVVMNSALASILLSVVFFSQSALAQRGETGNTALARARATFEATDANKDGRVSFDELKANALPIQKAEFEAQDFDHDGTWSREEFLVYYRQLLSSNGQRASDD